MLDTKKRVRPSVSIIETRGVDLLFVWPISPRSTGTKLPARLCGVNAVVGDFAIGVRGVSPEFFFFRKLYARWCVLPPGCSVAWPGSFIIHRLVGVASDLSNRTHLFIYIFIYLSKYETLCSLNVCFHVFLVFFFAFPLIYCFSCVFVVFPYGHMTFLN